MDGVKIGVAVVALGGFFSLVAYMLTLTSVTEMQWTRTVYLFTGVEAIAFAAAGFFFGREVHRERAQQAEARADAAQGTIANARAATADAERKGRDLATTVRAVLQGYAEKMQSYGTLEGNQSVQVIQADLNQLRTVANALFPE